jgi:hypothetical protein
LKSGFHTATPTSRGPALQESYYAFRRLNERNPINQFQLASAHAFVHEGDVIPWDKRDLGSCLSSLPLIVTILTNTHLIFSAHMQKKQMGRDIE